MSEQHGCLLSRGGLGGNKNAINVYENVFIMEHVFHSYREVHIGRPYSEVNPHFQKNWISLSFTLSRSQIIRQFLWRFLKESTFVISYWWDLWESITGTAQHTILIFKGCLKTLTSHLECDFNVMALPLRMSCQCHLIPICSVKMTKVVNYLNTTLYWVIL